MTDQPPPDNDNSAPQGTIACPICGQPAQERWRPFCSKRCSDVDLHRWLSGSYAIPAEEADWNEENERTT